MDAIRRPAMAVARHPDLFERQADALAERALARREPGPAFTVEARFDNRLPHSLQRRLESVAPYDFSRVRVRDDRASHQESRRLGAAAFTRGPEVSLARASGAGSRTDRERVLAHEAIHAAQQGALPRTSGDAAGSVWRSPSGVAQRIPGVDAEDSWRELVSESFVPDEPGIRSRGTEARARFLQAQTGQRVINSLWHLSRDRVRRPRFDVGLAFRAQMPSQVRSLDADGFFEPDAPDANHYSVSVKDVRPRDYPSITIGGTTGEGVAFSHTDPESDMASTIHHELWHIDFLRRGLGIRWPTGHGDVSRGEVEPAFREGIASFSHDIDAIEGRIHQEARRQQETPAPEPQPDLDAHRPSAPQTPSGPPFAGFRVGADAGVAGQAGARFTGVARADLVLGRITSLNLGARGIYLTPNRLFAGGAVGLQFNQAGDSRPGATVENPLFFDIEAGVVGQLNSAEADRVLNHVGAYGSLGVGQEFGTSGARFFWRVGGYVVISDRGESFGGGTAGIGARFQ